MELFRKNPPEPDTEEIICTDCHGTGASNCVFYDDIYADEANREENPCNTCNGYGKVERPIMTRESYKKYFQEYNAEENI